jgi:IclR family transcriptional regulator, acetate operon repressor
MVEDFSDVEPSFEKSVMGRSLMLLEAISRAGRPLSLGILADVTHLPKSTVHRMANQLMDLGLLDRSDRGFSLGLRIFEWGSQAEKQRDLRRIATPYLSDLHRRLGETVHLGVLDGGEVLYIEKIEARSAISCPTYVCGRRPAHATALGKAMLAFSPQAARSLIETERLPLETRSTIRHGGLLYRQLLDIRTQLVSVEREESFLGIACVAAPILNRRGGAVGAISITSSTLHFDAARFAPLIRRTAGQIARELAGREEIPLDGTLS